MIECQMEEDEESNATADENSTKHLVLKSKKDTSSQSSKAQSQKKDRRKKIVALTDAWIQIAETHSTKESQLELLHTLLSTNPTFSTVENNILLTHLKTKQSGYRAQDVEKGIHDPTRFVTIDDIIQNLCRSNLSCYYCKGWTKLFYEFVRDPKQWSLERLSNAEGHNRNNVVIACLECNMRRRTMYHERYLATKQLRVNKLEPNREDDSN